MQKSSPPPFELYEELDERHGSTVSALDKARLTAFYLSRDRLLGLLNSQRLPAHIVAALQCQDVHMSSAILSNAVGSYLLQAIAGGSVKTLLQLAFEGGVKVGVPFIYNGHVTGIPLFFRDVGHCDDGGQRGPFTRRLRRVFRPAWLFNESINLRNQISRFRGPFVGRVLLEPHAHLMRLSGLRGDTCAYSRSEHRFDTTVLISTQDRSTCAVHRAWPTGRDQGPSMKTRKCQRSRCRPSRQKTRSLAEQACEAGRVQVMVGLGGRKGLPQLRKPPLLP